MGEPGAGLWMPQDLGLAQGKVVSVHTWPRGCSLQGWGRGLWGRLLVAGAGWLVPPTPYFLSFTPRGSWQGTDLPRAVGSTMQVKPETLSQVTRHLLWE